MTIIEIRESSKRPMKTLKVLSCELTELQFELGRFVHTLRNRTWHLIDSEAQKRSAVPLDRARTQKPSPVLGLTASFITVVSEE